MARESEKRPNMSGRWVDGINKDHTENKSGAKKQTDRLKERNKIC